MQEANVEQLSPEALEDRYTDVLSQFQSMTAPGEKAYDESVDSENAQAEQRPVLQQLSPVSKFLHNIQPSDTQLLASANSDPIEREVLTYAAVAAPQCSGGALSQDHTSTDTLKAKHSPPKFTQDGACDANHAHRPSVDHPPHIPRQLLQQLAAQELRIHELETELAAEKQQVVAQAGP
jgi:hypothetical protein